MSPVYRMLQNIFEMYKGNNINNKLTRQNNALNGAEGNNNSSIYQTIIKMYNILNVDYQYKPI